MLILFLILIVLASVVLGFIILVQNPKGGGLAGNIGGLGNQFMGVKQTTDILEKGTWIFAIMIALLCIFSTVFMPKAGSGDGRELNVKPTTTNTTPANQPVPGNSTPANNKPQGNNQAPSPKP